MEDEVKKEIVSRIAALEIHDGDTIVIEAIAPLRTVHYEMVKEVASKAWPHNTTVVFEGMRISTLRDSRGADECGCDERCTVCGDCLACYGDCECTSADGKHTWPERTPRTATGI